MLNHLFTNSRTWPTRLFLGLGLVACLSWLALWCFRQPVLHGSAPRGKSLVETRDQKNGQKEAQKENSGQQLVAPQMSGAEARQYLEQTDEGYCQLNFLTKRGLLR